jgi:D-glycero-D-manno-heptose 1,7-bisphosphate phosphatase
MPLRLGSDDLYCGTMPAPKSAARGAVFLDRDGTVAHEVGYVNHPDRFRIYAFAPRAVRLLNAAGYRVFIVTNQSGVARGYFTQSVLDEVHERLRASLARGGARIEAIYACPHYDGKGEPCACRKPRPGMLHEAAREHGVDLAASWVVGDMITDVEMGKSVGARGILLRTGYGTGQIAYQRARWRVEPDHVCDNLLDAARLIAAAAAAPGGPA